MIDIIGTALVILAWLAIAALIGLKPKSKSRLQGQAGMDDEPLTAADRGSAVDARGCVGNLLPRLANT